MSAIVKMNSNNVIVYLMAILTSIVNILFFNNSTISLMYVFVECMILMICFITNNLPMYMALYIIFLSLSVEFNFFAGTDDFVNIKNLRFAGLNMGIWLFIPVIIMSFSKCIGTSKIKSKFKLLYKMFYDLLAMNVISLIMGAVLISFNDNGIQNIGRVSRIYIEYIYMYVLIPCCIFFGITSIALKNEKDLKKIKIALISALCGSVMELLVSKLFGVYGMGYIQILLSSAIIVFIPFLLLYTQYMKKYRVLFYVISFIGIILSIKYSSSGKMILTLLLCISLMPFVGKKRIERRFLIIFSSLFLMIAAIFIMKILADSNEQLEIKFDQTISVIRIWENEWLNRVGMSPRIRIEEILDVIIEYTKKPFLLLTGKGYVGSVMDHRLFISNIPENSRGGTFSEAEYAKHVFYSLHEIARPFLVFGLMWIVFIVKNIKITVKGLKYNPWIILGLYWFVIYYGYSFTVSVFGTACLFIGYCEAEKVHDESLIFSKV